MRGFALANGLAYDTHRAAVRRIVLATVAAVAIAMALFAGGATPVPSPILHIGPSFTPMQLRLLSGSSQQQLTNMGLIQAQAATQPEVELGGDSEGNGVAPGTTVGGPAVPVAGVIGSASMPGANGSCEENAGSNVRVNTACTNYADAAFAGRSQAQNETAIAINPTNSQNLVASANDYMRGDGNCGAYFSDNGGHSWNGTTAPLLFVSGSSLTPASGNPRQYWQAGGDTTVAYNAEGTAYLQCQVFNRGAGTTQDPDLSSGVLVFRSANGGASWDFPGRVALSSYEPNSTFPNGVVLEDKPLMAIDNHSSSPFKDNIYITWTSFSVDGSAYIYVVRSTDGGETWSARQAISGNSATLCPTTFGAGTPFGSCNENQFSDPFVGPDGALYVAYNNFNNGLVSATDNRNQVLMVKSTDGGVTFSAPIKVSDYFDLPTCYQYTGQDFGRACVVNKGATPTTCVTPDKVLHCSVFRATNYPSGAVDPTNPNHIVINFGSYINSKSNEGTGCVPASFGADGNNAYTGAGTTACNNQILQSDSWNAGGSFNGTTTDPRSLPLAAKQSKLADEYWQWTGITSSGKVVVGFYDREYGNDDTTGASDYSVAINGGHTRRITTVSSPFETQFGGLFYGDYNVLAVSGNHIWVTWTDTRNPGLTSCPGHVNLICTLGNDEDDFAAAVILDD